MGTEQTWVAKRWRTKNNKSYSLVDKKVLVMNSSDGNVTKQIYSVGKMTKWKV